MLMTLIHFALVFAVQALVAVVHPDFDYWMVLGQRMIVHFLLIAFVVVEQMFVADLVLVVAVAVHFVLIVHSIAAG